MASGGSVRLFVAVPIEASAAARAADIQQQLRAHCAQAGWQARWVARENLHLTLKFLGATEPGRVETLAETLAPVGGRAPFSIRLAGVGAFPPVGRPRVVWLGIEEGARDLAAIAEDVEARLETIGFSRERRRFHAHLTLARVKSARSRAEDVLHPWRQADAGRSQVREVVLYRSTLEPSGAVYTPVRRIPLGGQEPKGSAPGGCTG